MASKIVARRWKSSMFVVSAYRVHKEDILDGVANLGKGLEGSGEVEPQETFFFKPAAISPAETRAAAETFLDHVMGTVEHRAAVLIGADHAKLGKADIEALRRIAKTKTADELRRQYVRQRDAFVNLYDELLARRAGFESNVETEAVLLVFQVRRAVDGLAALFDAGETFAGVTVDVSAYGKALEPNLLKLESILHQVNFDTRTTQGRLRIKDLAIEAHDVAFSAGARCLEAVFRLAGMPELADRVRPSERRPGRREDEVIGEEGEGPPAPGFEALGIDEPPLPDDSDSQPEEPADPAPAPEGEEPQGDG